MTQPQANNIDNEDPDIEARFWSVPLTKIADFGCYDLSVLLESGVFFALICDKHFPKHKAQSLLGDLHAAMRKLYKHNLQFMARQKNLKPNVYDQIFKPQFTKVMENHDSAIDFVKIDIANDKTEELRLIAARKLEKM